MPPPPGHRVLVLWALAAVAIAADGVAPMPGAPAAGDHRRGVRVQLELVPAAVRTCFRTHGGEDLTAVLRRTDASGQLVYVGRVRDPDETVQVLVVSPTGAILGKEPPRHHAAWTLLEDPWAVADDGSLWGSSGQPTAASTTWSLWGDAVTDPLVEASHRRDPLLGARLPVGALTASGR